jgi:hypothetical protein
MYDKDTCDLCCQVKEHNNIDKIPFPWAEVEVNNSSTNKHLCDRCINELRDYTKRVYGVK